MNAEDALRAALRARSGDFAPSPGAWADNQARVRRRVRARRVTVSFATATALVMTGAAAVAWPRPDRVAVVPGASSSPSASPSPSGSPRPTAPPPHAFHAPDLRGMDPAEVRALTDKCVQAFLDPIQELPYDSKLAEAPEDYRLIYLLPAWDQPWGPSDHHITLHAGEQLLECWTTLDSPGTAHGTGLGHRWLTAPVTGPARGGSEDGSWGGSGRYTADVARIEVEPHKGDPRVEAIMDNGYWVAGGVATHGWKVEWPPPRRPTYPRVRGYGYDGTLLYDSATWDISPLCYRLPDGSLDSGVGDPPTSSTNCAPTYPWP